MISLVRNPELVRIAEHVRIVEHLRTLEHSRIILEHDTLLRIRAACVPLVATTQALGAFIQRHPQRPAVPKDNIYIYIYNI